MGIKDWPGKIREAVQGRQEEATTLSEWRDQQLKSFNDDNKDNFDSIFNEAYADEPDKRAAGRAFFRPLWEQVLAEFFVHAANSEEPPTFNDMFASFYDFCVQRGWDETKHGSSIVLFKLAMYTRLVKNPPPPAHIDGIVEKVIKSVQDVMSSLGIEPSEVADLIKRLVQLLV